jgi:hypothetical protein
MLIMLISEKTDTIKKNTAALLDASKEVGLEVKPEETRYMLISHSQKIGQRHSIKIVNKSFEVDVKLKFLGITLKDQSSIHEEIKSRLIQGMLATIRFSLLPFCLLSRNVKVKIYKTVSLLVVLYGCKTWSLALRQEHGLRAFENRVLRRLFRPKGDGSDRTMEKFARWGAS